MVDRTPAYYSVFGNTSEMMLSNVSQWKPSWAQSKGGDKVITAMELSTRNKSRTSHTRANNSVYNGLLTAPNATTTVYCTLIESRSVSPLVGLCMINSRTSSLTIIEIQDSPTFVRTINKLNVHSDTDNLHLLLPSSYQKRRTNIVKLLEANIRDNASIYYIPDVAFKVSNESFKVIGSNVKEGERESMRVELSHRKLGYAATCACIAYIQALPQNTFVHESFNVKFESCEDSLFISSCAIRDLELLESNTDNDTGKTVSLFKFLNCTMTKMGERLLRNNIRQPLTSKESLILRYEAVNELVDDEGALTDLRLEMKGMIDLDNLFSVLCKKAVSSLDAVNDQMINFVLMLKNVLVTIKGVREVLTSLHSKLISEIRFTLENKDIDAALVLISEYINEDCIWVSKPVELRNQKCYAVKVGQNGILDASRQLYKKLVDEVLKSIEELGERFKIDLENRYDKNRGFYIFLKDMDITIFEDFENSPFINIVQKGKSVECTTMDIMKLNLRIDSVLDEIFLMTEDAVNELVDKCRKFIPTFFLVSEAFAILDLVCCFAKIIAKPDNNYTCPEFDGRNIAIKESRHPLLEYIYKSDKNNHQNKVIGNDVTIISETSRVQLITGPNMSGKSIYIKQFSLNIVLAQIGMFVPAEYASIRIFKSLFTRLANDTMEPNMSTFSMEMVEMADILHHADSDSLIIIDELGRGTGYNDAMALCLSIIEEIRELRAVCLFVTHFVGVPRVFQNKPGIFELQMGGGADSKFRISPGVNTVTGYGIQLVESTKMFTEEVVACAKEISNKLKLASAATMVDGETQGKRNRQTKLILNCYQMLNHVVHNVSEIELFETIAALENEFIEQYDPIIAEAEIKQDKVTDDQCREQDGVDILEELLDLG